MSAAENLAIPETILDATGAQRFVSPSHPLPVSGTTQDPTAGTNTLTVAAALNGGASLPCQAVLLQSDPGNTVNLVWGDSAHQYNVLPPGASVVIPVSDVNKVWVAAAGSVSSRVNWVAGSAGLLQVSASSAPVATGADNWPVTQVAVSVSAQVLAARVGRKAVVLKNLDPVNAIYVAQAGPVTTATGFQLLPGESWTIPTAGAVFAVASAGSPVLNCVELY